MAKARFTCEGGYDNSGDAKREVVRLRKRPGIVAAKAVRVRGRRGVVEHKVCWKRGR